MKYCFIIIKFVRSTKPNSIDFIGMQIPGYVLSKHGWIYDYKYSKARLDSYNECDAGSMINTKEKPESGKVSGYFDSLKAIYNRSTN